MNVANGADDSAIADTIIAADDWLANYDGKLPYNVPRNTKEGKPAILLSSDLHDWNEGIFGPGKCPKKL